MAFGDPPSKARGTNWFNEKVALLDAELKSLNNEYPINSKFKQRLNDRFVERSVDSVIQLELLQHLDEQVKNYASFCKRHPKPAAICRIVDLA